MRRRFAPVTALLGVVALLVTALTGVAPSSAATSRSGPTASIEIVMDNLGEYQQTSQITGRTSGLPAGTAIAIDTYVDGSWREVSRVHPRHKRFTKEVTLDRAGWRKYRARAIDVTPAVVSNTEKIYARTRATLDVHLQMPYRTVADQRVKILGTTDAPDGAVVKVEQQYVSGALKFTVAGGAFSGRLPLRPQGTVVNPHNPGNTDYTVTVQPTGWQQLPTTIKVASLVTPHDTVEFGRDTIVVASPADTSVDVPVDYLYGGDQLSLRTTPGECDHRPNLILASGPLPAVDGVWRIPGPATEKSGGVIRLYECGSGPRDFLMDLVDRNEPAATPDESTARTADTRGLLRIGFAGLYPSVSTSPLQMRVHATSNLSPDETVELQRRTTGTDTWRSVARTTTDLRGRIDATFPGPFSGGQFRLAAPANAKHDLVVSRVRSAVLHNRITLRPGADREVAAPQTYVDYQFTATAGQQLRVTTYFFDGDFGTSSCDVGLYGRGQVIAGRTSYDGFDQEYSTFDLPDSGGYSVRLKCYDPDYSDPYGATLRLS